MKRFVALTALLISTMASAEIYEVIDANGRKTYTDVPPVDQPDAKPVEVAPQTGNAWSKDNVQQQNDRYYDALKKKQDTEEQQVQELAEQKEENDKRHQDAVSEAEQALENAKELKTGDYYINPNQAGIRHTQEYRDRVKQAKENLERARKNAEAEAEAED